MRSRDAQPPARRVPEQPDTDGAGLRADREVAGGDARAGERGIEAHRRVGLSTPRQFGPTIRRPAPRTISSTRSSSSRPSSPRSAKPAVRINSAFTPLPPLGGDIGHVVRRDRDDHKLRWLVELGQTARHADGADDAPCPVDGRRHPLEPAVEDVPQDRAAEVAGALEAPTTASEAGARIGRSEATTPRWSRASMRSSTASSGLMSSDTVSSPYALLRRTPKPARSKTLNIPWSPCITSASKRWIARSAAIAASCSSSASRRRVLGTRPQPRMPPRRRRAAQDVIAGSRHDAIALPADQGHPVVAVGVRVVRRGHVDAPVAMEAQVAALGREPAVERLEVVEIFGPRRPQAQGRAIPQEHVANERRRRHAHSSQW